jgi:hypothetical protein
VPSIRLRGIDDRRLPPGAWLRERVGVALRKLRIRADPVQLPPPPYVDLMLRARSAGRVETTMRIDGDYVFSTYEERRALYTDFLTGFLVPRTTIWSGDHLVIDVNALGCRGPEPTPGLPAVAFLGDSTTLGVMGTEGGIRGESWTEHVDLPGYAVLNAGVEGLQMHDARRRYELLRERVPLACAVFYTGWHNLIYNPRTPDYWEECLQSYRSPEHATVVCTLPSALLPEMRSRGIAELVDERPEASIADDYFHFWRGWDPDEWLPELLDALERFNAHVVDFCARTATPLLDLARLLRPPAYERASEDFFDVCHFRPRAYPKVAAHVSAALRELLEAGPAPVAAPRPRAGEPAAEPAEDLRRNIYPVW